MENNSSEGSAAPVLGAADLHPGTRSLSRGDGPNVFSMVHLSGFHGAAQTGPWFMDDNIRAGMGDAFPNWPIARPSGFASFHNDVRRILVQPGPSTVTVEPPSREVNSPASSCQATSEPRLPQEEIKTVELTEEDNELSVKTPEKDTNSAALPSSGCEATTKTIDKTQLFVTLLTVRLLQKCRVLDICTEKDMATYAKQLVNKTLQGLTVQDGFCPEDKDIKLICRAVIKDLSKKLGGKSSLKFVILLQQPSVEAVIVNTLKDHISKHSTVSANKKKKSSRSKLFWPAISLAAVCGVWFILAIIFL